jgi:hypothetical protein
MKLIAKCAPEELTTDRLGETGARLGATRIAGYELREKANADLGADAGPSASEPGGVMLVWFPDDELPAAKIEALAAAIGSEEIIAVEENVRFDAGGRQPIARISFLCRQPGLSHDEFAEHWLDVHTKLVLEHDPLFSRYVANVATASAGFDGVVEQHFSDEETWDEHDRRLVFERPAVKEDLPKFLGEMRQFAGSLTADLDEPTDAG